MTSWNVTFSSPLNGSLRPPGSKSQTLRAILFASLSQEGGTISYPLESQDSVAMLQACEQLGASFEKKRGIWSVKPVNPHIAPAKTLCFDAMNSGIVWRFLAGVLSSRSNLSLIWGDSSILNRRPMQPLTKALSQVGVDIWQTQENKGPCLVKGPWKYIPERIEMEGFDSQPVSAMLIAAAFQEKSPISIRVHDPKEVEWAHLTVHWLRALGVQVEADASGENYKVFPQRWKNLHYVVPVDYSSAAFMIAAALISRGKVILDGLIDDPQPDRALVRFLQEAGADLFLDEKGSLHINGEKGFEGVHADLNGPIDLLPVLMALACYARSPSCFYGIAGARLKESDRVSAMTLELIKMGAHIEVFHDELKIWPSSLKGSLALQSHEDHRVAMALAVAALGARGASMIHQVQCSAKTYPDFAQDLKRLGAHLHVID